MKRLMYLILLISLAGCSQSQNNSSNNSTMKDKLPEGQIPKTEAEWKEILSTEQYGILRMKGTERPGTGQFLYHKEKGIYTCGGCGTELFSSDMKFDSHCGWPSFDRELEGGKIKQIADFSHGMIRTEIVCARCGGHLGHIFDDGPTETGMRYCVNSLSLSFKKTE